MEKLQVFNNVKFGSIRTIKKDNEIWFVGKDVATALGYERPTKAIADHVEREDKDEVPIQDTIGRMQKTPIINESGLYSLVLSSKLPSAKQFKRWITSEVLPSIRKHGGYLTSEKIEEALLNPDTLIKLATKLKQERAKRIECEKGLQKANNFIEEAKPKLTYYDTILNSKGTMSATQIGADYGLSAIKLNQILRDWRLIRKVGGQYVLYAEFQNQGLTESKTHEVNQHGEIVSYVQTKWTQKGRLKIHEILTSLGYVANYDKTQTELMFA